MIHYAHGATSGPACIAYDNTRTTRDLVVTGLTFIRDNVTCRNCLADVDDTGNVTEDAARAQNALAYDPLDFGHIPADPNTIFVNPVVMFTVIVCPADARGDVTRRDTPDQAGFAVAEFGHFHANEARAYAERQALTSGFAVVYPLVRYPRHLRAYRPIAYRDGSTWYRVI
jgi:hypothetical protein